MNNMIPFEEGTKKIDDHGDFPLSAMRLSKLVGVNHMMVRRAAKALGLVAPVAKARVVYSKASSQRIWAEICEYKNRKAVIL